LPWASVTADHFFFQKVLCLDGIGRQVKVTKENLPFVHEGKFVALRLFHFDDKIVFIDLLQRLNNICASLDVHLVGKSNPQCRIFLHLDLVPC
jgi:hypothetical protein